MNVSPGRATARSILSLALAGTLAGCAGAVPASPVTLTPEASPFAGLTIRYDEQAQFELTLPGGRRVYLDVRDGGLLEAAPREDDVLLVTNMAPHHDDPAFAAAFPGARLIQVSGEIRLDDLHIRAIDYSDRETPVDHQYPGGEAFLIEAAGLRIVACGDLDQASLEADQLAVIGSPVDVALCPIVNGGSGPDISGKYALDVLDQMHARLVIPTHSSIDGATAATARWSGKYVDGPVLRVDPATLPTTSTVVFLGDQARNYGALLKLPLQARGKSLSVPYPSIR